MARVTQERLKELLDYNPSTGIFVWKVTRNQFVFPGRVAGSTDSSGHTQIMIDGVGYGAHRLVWLYMYGSFPDEQIDHKNRVKSDNRLDNLRLADYGVNSENKGKYKNNKSGHKGVCWNKSKGAWQAQIKKNGRTYHIGTFSNLEVAAKAYLEASRKLHGHYNP